MVKRTITTCDKCGAPCDYHYHLEMQYHTNGPLRQAEVDLCSACLTSLTGSLRDWRNQPVFRPLVAPFMAPIPE